jgi:cytochrome c
MDSFEWNKVFAAILIALIVAMLGHLLAGVFVNPTKLEKNVYVVDAPIPGEALDTQKPLAPITPLLAAADIGNGEKIFKKCLQCHTPTKGGAHTTGPNLWGIVGNSIAHAADFAYSQGMKDKHEQKWGFEELNAFLHKPRDFIKGTKMSFVGLKDDKERADIIAYLNSLNDTPQSLK